MNAASWKTGVQRHDVSSRKAQPRPSRQAGKQSRELRESTLRILAGKESSFWSSTRTGKMESLFLSLRAQGVQGTSEAIGTQRAVRA